MKDNKAKLNLAIEEAESVLEKFDTKAVLIIATDGIGISGSVPDNSFITTVLITSALDESSDEVKKAVKKYLEGGC